MWWKKGYSRSCWRWATKPWGRVSKSPEILDRLLNLPNAAFVSAESACLAQ
jgi:hypothetical protein